MSILTLLGLDRLGAPPGAGMPAGAHTRLAAALREALTALPPARAEFVAAFAGLMVRVAYVDREISPAEREALRRGVVEHAALSAAEADLVVEIVTRHATAIAGIDYAALTRSFGEVATEQEKLGLLDCLYVVAAAERSVSVEEDEEIRAVARALLLSHSQFIAVRQRYTDSLEVIQAVRRDRDKTR